MTVAFWVSAALLIAGALLFVLPPLLRPVTAKGPVASPLDAYREQRAQFDADLAQGVLLPAQHARALEELQARVVAEVGDAGEPAPLKQMPPSMALVVALALLVPAGALGLYGALGTPSAVGGGAAPVAANREAAPHAVTREQMEEMVEGLAEKLRQNPADPAGWHMLARSYLAFNRLPESAQAFDRANAQAPGNPQLLSDYADVLAMVNGRSLEGAPERLVLQALEIDPKHQKSLALAGTAAFNRSDFPMAAQRWKQLLAVLPPGSDQAKAVQENIEQAEAGGAPVAAGVGKPAPVAAAAPAAPAAGSAEVHGNVTVADAVKGSMAPGAVLFIYARPADGSRMPLAIARQPAGDFPVRFKLDDASAMSPQAKLSMHTSVMLVARISRTGNALPQPGDITGTLGPVKVGTRDAQLVINEVVK